jgi:hypothetical protein
VKGELTESDRKAGLNVETVLHVLGFKDEDGVAKDFNEN